MSAAGERHVLCFADTVTPTDTPGATYRCRAHLFVGFGHITPPSLTVWPRSGGQLTVSAGSVTANVIQSDISTGNVSALDCVHGAAEKVLKH